MNMSEQVKQMVSSVSADLGYCAENAKCVGPDSVMDFAIAAAEVHDNVHLILSNCPGPGEPVRAPSSYPDLTASAIGSLEATLKNVGLFTSRDVTEASFDGLNCLVSAARELRAGVADAAVRVSAPPSA